MLYLHGGGYRLGSPAAYRHFTWRIADAVRARVLIIDYRLAPEHPFPAALDDAVAAYRWLLRQDPNEIVVMGESAGGGLTLALLMKLRDEGMPSARCRGRDVALDRPRAHRRVAHRKRRRRSDAQRRRSAGIRRPTISPAPTRAILTSRRFTAIRAGLPPVLILAGSDEILRDDAIRMADKLRAANPRSELQVWPRMAHAWPLFAPVMPEARAAIADIGGFVQRILGSRGA